MPDLHVFLIIYQYYQMLDNLSIEHWRKDCMYTYTHVCNLHIYIVHKSTLSISLSRKNPKNYNLNQVFFLLVYSEPNSMVFLNFFLFICQFEAETMLKNKASVLRTLSLDPGITLLALLSVISARVSDEFLSSCLVRKCQNQQVDRNENS